MSTETPLPIEEHPDVVAMRARYEQAAETPTAQLVDGLTLLAGLYAAISPWVVGFNDRFPALTANNFILGVALAVLAVGFASAYGRTHGLTWTAPLIGGWLIVAPWVIQGDMAETSTVLNNVIVGGVTVAFGLAAMGIGMTRARTTK